MRSGIESRPRSEVIKKGTKTLPDSYSQPKDGLTENGWETSECRLENSFNGRMQVDIEVKGEPSR